MGERDLSELQLKIRPSLGSTAEQQSVFQEFGIPSRTFELYKTGNNSQVVCEVAVNIGYLDDALSLIENKQITLRNSVFVNIFNYIQARDILNKRKPQRNQRGHSSPKMKSIVFASLQQHWRSLSMALGAFMQKGSPPKGSFLNERILRGYFDLLVCILSSRYVMDMS